MSTTYQSGYKTTLALPLAAADTTMEVAVAPTITQGRLFIQQGNTKEWVSFTGVSGTTITGLTRGLSQTADPATAGTGSSFIAGATVKIVAMHDQLQDKQYPVATVYADTTARDAALGGDGAATEAYTDVYTTAEGLHRNYNLSTAQWESVDTGTTTPNMSTIVAGKGELSTVAEQGTATATGGSGAPLVPANENLVKTSSGASDENKIAVLNSQGLYDNFISYSPFGDGSDGDSTISANTTLSGDIYQYDNLTIDATYTLTFDAGGLIILKVKDTLTINGTIDISHEGGVSSETLFGLSFSTTGASGGAGQTRGGAGGAGGAGGVYCGGGGGGGGVYSRAGGAGGDGSDTATNRLGGDAVTEAVGNAGSAGGGGSGAEKGGNTSGYGGGDDESTLAGGSGSGSYSTYEGGGGGGGAGGKNGSVIFIIANTIAGNGTIQALGENGYDGGDGTTSSGTEMGGGGGGGGAGGAGGQVGIVYKTSTQTWTITTTAGTGGTLGTGYGSPTGGANGTDGNAGVSSLRDIKYITN